MSHDELRKRFEASTQRDGACLIWTRGKSSRGYGAIHVAGRQLAAHRVAWELAHGAIPEGLHVLHRCDTPACVEPAHLFLGTHAENMADKREKGRGRGPWIGPHCYRRTNGYWYAYLPDRGSDPRVSLKTSSESVARERFAALTGAGK